MEILLAVIMLLILKEYYKSRVHYIKEAISPLTNDIANVLRVTLSWKK